MSRLTFLLPLLLAGCAGTTTTTGAGEAAADTRPAATARLVDASGADRGTASFYPTADGVRLVYHGVGVPAGAHGIHLHTTGRCDAPDFQTAGGHWNPTQHKHGSESPEGPHAGDMPNLTAAADGSVHYETLLAGVTLRDGASPLLDADGAALLVHATADDYRTDPSGNSGARIACGVVQAG